MDQPSIVLKMVMKMMRKPLQLTSYTKVCLMHGLDLNMFFFIIIIITDDSLQNANHSLNISMMNHTVYLHNVTVTLQWPGEFGIIYHVNVFPDTSLTKSYTVISHNTIIINLTISYNIQLSIVSSLCGVTTVSTRVLKHGKNKINCMHRDYEICQINLIHYSYHNNILCWHWRIYTSCIA